MQFGTVFVCHADTAGLFFRGIFISAEVELFYALLHFVRRKAHGLLVLSCGRRHRGGMDGICCKEKKKELFNLGANPIGFSGQGEAAGNDLPPFLRTIKGVGLNRQKFFYG